MTDTAQPPGQGTGEGSGQRPGAARPDWVRHAGGGVALWVPPYWEGTQAEGVQLAVLGPVEPYRANVTVNVSPVDGPATLEQIAEASADAQRRGLANFLEYDRRPTSLAGLPAIERQYAWIEQPPGVVLYQHQLLALLGQGGQSSQGGQGGGARLLQVHFTSEAPAYFRYASLFRRIAETVTL